MKASRTLILIAVIVSAVPALARTDKENFQKRVGKSAALDAGFPAKPKATCVCQDASNTGFAGVLRQFPSNPKVPVDCLIPSFDSTTGEQTGFVSCFTYVVLPK
jgi:hypothetical protein